MPNAIKYNVSAQTLALKEGDFWIGTGDVSKGPTVNTDYWNGITPPVGGYTIYLGRLSQSPVAYVAANDAELISLTNRIASTSYTTTAQCFTYYAGQPDKMVLNRDYESIITNGLLLNLDAGFVSSYPRTGTTWYDLSGQDNHAVIDVATYSSSGYFTSVISPGYASLLEFTTQITGNLATALSVTSGGWSIEEWILVNDTTYPEAAAGSVVSNGAYGAGDIGFDWNHGQTGMSQFQMGASWNVGQTVNYDVRGYITLSAQFTNYGSWYLRHMFWNRNTAKMGVYYNGIFQGDIDISALNGYPICDGGTIIWGQLYGWRHDGARGGMRIYNRILSSSEILQNFNAQKSRYGL